MKNETKDPTKDPPFSRKKIDKNDQKNRGNATHFHVEIWAQVLSEFLWGSFLWMIWVDCGEKLAHNKATINRLMGYGKYKENMGNKYMRKYMRKYVRKYMRREKWRKMKKI